MRIFRGDLIYVDLGQHIGNVQSGIRVCTVVSNNINNRNANTLCVCPFTRHLKNNPVHVRVKPEDVKGYFNKESECLIEQIVTIDRSNIISKVGHISENSDVMKKIEQALMIQMGIKI